MTQSGNNPCCKGQQRMLALISLNWTEKKPLLRRWHKSNCISSVVWKPVQFLHGTDMLVFSNLQRVDIINCE